MSTIENLPEEKVAPAAPPVPENRIGQFQVSAAVLRENWLNLLPLFAHMVVIRAEFIYALDVIDYTAQSDLFEVSNPNCAPHEYDIVATKKEDGSLTYTAQKVLSLADIQLKAK